MSKAPVSPKRMVSRTSLIVFITLISFLSMGCAPKRQLGFSSIKKNYQENNNTVTIKDVTINVQVENTDFSEEFSPDARQIFEGRLKERLLEQNLAVVYHDDAKYRLSGNILIKEDCGYNGLVVPAFIVGIGLFPVGLFIMAAIPYNDLNDTISADMTLVKTDSGEVLFKKVFSNEFDGSVNGYQGRPVPYSKLNYTLATTADDVFKELSLEVSQKVHAQ